MIKDINAQHSTMPRNYKHTMDILVGKHKYSFQTQEFKDPRQQSSFESEPGEDEDKKQAINKIFVDVNHSKKAKGQGFKTLKPQKKIDAMAKSVKQELLG